jgi:DNA-binding MarR family transcriptional regulator
MANNPEMHAGWSELENKPEHAIGFLLKSIQHTLRQTFDEALRKQGVDLSFAQFVALFGLSCEPGVTGAQLARRAMVSAQTMNSALHRLEVDGLIERRPHPHSRRADSWSLTADGLAELARARDVGRDIFTRMLSPLSAAEISNLDNYLRRCIAALETPSHDGSAATAQDSKRVNGRAAAH